MAKLERGKGKRKQVVEITQHGAVLRLRENDGGDERLPGYRRFRDDASAQAGLAAEVRARLDDGMQPADDEARAIADAGGSKEPAAPSLPLRRDLEIYNEATGFVITSRRMAGKTLEEGSPQWKKAVAAGDLIPLMLVQDDPFLIRIVAGEPLSAQEAEEWVARVDWHLNLKDGRLCVTGGSVFSNDDYDADNPYHEQYVGQVDLPAGRYRTALYTHVHGVNGGGVMDHLAGGYDKGEALDAWFGRTRAGEAKPNWDEIELVEFLLHLEPVDAAPKSGLSVLPDDGWFGGDENARKPARCPLGIVARDVVRRLDENSGQFTYVREAFDNRRPPERKIVKGDAVSLPVDSLARAARISWFASRLTVAELKLTPPAGASVNLEDEWPEGVIVVEEGGAVRILFDADLDMSGILERLPKLASVLAGVPDGTVLDLCCSPVETLPGSPEDAGLLWLRGPIRAGAWRVGQAWPEVEGATLQSALSLGPEVSIEAFADRFGKVWPVTVRIQEDDSDDDDEGDGLFPTKPIVGLQILVAASGRAYHQTMAMLVSEKIGAEIPKRERGLFSSGFKHVGDLVCLESENVGIRGYARPGGNMWTFFRVSAPDEIQLEVASIFDGGVVLTRSEEANPENAKELIATHESRLAEMGESLGLPQPTVLTMKGFAEACEVVRSQAPN